MRCTGRTSRGSSREDEESRFTGNEETRSRPQLSPSRSSCELLLESDVQRHIDVSWDEEAQPTQRPVEIE
eukprot:756566-Hanusia_phi.AAC.1